MIPFNKQNLFGNELEYIKEAYAANKVSGDGEFTKWCNDFIESKFETKKMSFDKNFIYKNSKNIYNPK